VFTFAIGVGNAKQSCFQVTLKRFNKFYGIMTVNCRLCEPQTIKPFLQILGVKEFLKMGNFDNVMTVVITAL